MAIAAISNPVEIRVRFMGSILRCGLAVLVAARTPPVDEEHCSDSAASDHRITVPVGGSTAIDTQADLTTSGLRRRGGGRDRFVASFRCPACRAAYT
jgi:hypothetical protein